MKKTLLLAVVLILSCLGAKAASYFFSPSEAASLKALLGGGELRPGDRIILRDGVYRDLGAFDFSARGSLDAPVTFCAEHPGAAVFSGPLTIRLSGEYLRLEGLLFYKAWSAELCLVEFQKEEGVFASHCRMTECAIDDCNNPQKSEVAIGRMSSSISGEFWLGLHGTDNRIDHCYFANKRVGGLTVQIWLGEKDYLNNHRIDHNVFGYHKDYQGNGAETIRIGNSWSSQLPSHTLVEDNVFLHCDGEIEVISVKSCHNTVRRNLFYESRGGLVCRHGHDNILESNTFIGNDIDGTLGIRIINQNQTVYDNFIARTGGYGLLVRMGVYERPTAETDTELEPLTSYHRVENADIAYNWFFGCREINLLSGFGDKEPRHVRMWHNVFTGPADCFRVEHADLIPGNFNFEDNRYSLADGARPPFDGGFTPLEVEPDWAALERARVLDLMSVGQGPSWYLPCRTDRDQIIGHYR